MDAGSPIVILLRSRGHYDLLKQLADRAELLTGDACILKAELLHDLRQSVPLSEFMNEISGKIVPATPEIAVKTVKSKRSTPGVLNG